MPMKKITIGIATLAVFALFVSVTFASFLDVSTYHTYYDAITYVQDEGIVDGYDDGTYKPDQTINRAEFTKIIVNSQYDEDQIELCALQDHVFSDFDHNEWFTPYVCIAKQNGIIDGYPDGTFQPANTINFAEAAKIIVNGFQYDADEDTDPWYQGYVDVLEDNNAVPDSITAMDQEVTRGEMAEIIYRLETEESDDVNTASLIDDPDAPALSFVDTYSLPEGTHRPELFFHEDILYVLVVEHEEDIRHKGYIFDASDPSNIDFEDYETFVVSEGGETEEYGYGTDHRATILNEEIVVVFQSNVMDEEKEGECIGGPAEPCTESQHLMFARFALDGEEISTIEISSTYDFEEDNYPDMCVLADEDDLLVSTGWVDPDYDAEKGLKIRKIDVDGEILETYEYDVSDEGIPGSIGNSMFWTPDGELLMFSGSFDQISVSRLDEDFEMSEMQFFDLSDDETTFPTGVVYKDGYYYVGYSGRESGESAIEDNPLSPRLMILNEDLDVVEIIEISDEEGSGHVHPTLDIVGDLLFYSWSKSQDQSPQVFVEVFEISQ